ncbi:MAG: hypothetical protein RSD88_07180 [Anaerovoracaceae bacterium]
MYWNNGKLTISKEIFLAFTNGDESADLTKLFPILNSLGKIENLTVLKIYFPLISQAKKNGL